MAVRRSISLTLCWLLLLPALFAMHAPVKPECCLRNGAHHCDGTMDGMRMDGDADFVIARNLCPYQHGTVKLLVSALALASFRAYSAAMVSEAAIVWQKAQEFDTAVLERSSRGPPVASCY